jgi:hypothetical protein
MTQNMLVFTGHELSDSVHYIKPLYETPLLGENSVVTLSFVKTIIPRNFVYITEQPFELVQ